MLSLKGIDDLTSFAGWDEEFDIPEEHREAETPWFDPAEGIRWVSAVSQYVVSNENAVPEPDQVLSELREYEELFKRAHEIGSKWHFAMDL